MAIYIIFLLISLLSWWVQHSLTEKFKRYSCVPLAVPMTGRDVAQAMLQSHGIYNVQVVSVTGELTDHFNPALGTVNLSQGVYATNSVAAAAVAAHECGHAVQHSVGYSMLQLRSRLVPAVSFASRWMSIVLLVGIVVVQFFPYLLMAGIAMFMLTTLFSFVTLPVEIDASRRAIAWLEQSHITTSDTTAQAKDALRAAAYTYVVAALGSLATVIYYLSFLTGSRR